MRKRRGGDTRPQQFVRIELGPIIWNALQDIAALQARSVDELVTEIAHDSLRLAIHVYIAEFYRSDRSDGEDPA